MRAVVWAVCLLACASGGTELDLWRKPDARGRACASCHSPDGIELARYGYDAATLRRRATPHIGDADAQKLATYITALPCPEKLDPMKSRPMQPGGAALPGVTPADRDAALAQRLPKLLPKLFTGRIQELRSAHAALDEVLALDAASIPVGIVMNRLSEDKFHGDEHASLAHWIPDVTPIDDLSALTSAEDRYLANPTDENLLAIDAVYKSAWRATLPATQAIALEKARSLLRLQHQMRTGRLVPISTDPPDAAKPPNNPFWEIGDMARIYTNMGAAGMSLPGDVATAKSGGPSLKSQMEEMRLPWLWLGWIYDPSLQHTSYDRRTRYADWFSQLLIDDGPYPTHAAVMLVKKLATEAFDPHAWASQLPQHLTINFSWLLRDQNWKRYEPKDAEARKQYDKFLANSFRMFALLESEELGKTGRTYQRDPIVQQLRSMAEAVAMVDPSPGDAEIFRKAAEAVVKAKLTPG